MTDPRESAFLTDTAVDAAGDGRYHAVVADRWNIGANPNGGYLLAIAVRAMLAEAQRPDPLTVTAHYLSPPAPGPVEIRTTIVKAGRSFVTVTAEVWQGDRERVRLLGAFGDLAAQSGPSRVAARPPVIAVPDDCVPLSDLTEAAGRPIPEAMRRYDLRLPKDTPWGATAEGDPLEISGWIRFADGTPIDVLSLVTVTDAFPPALLGTVTAGWVPTLELTVHVRARPVPGWLLGNFRTRFLVDGMFEEDGEVWDESGRPVALSRQLALVLRPPTRS